MNEELLQHQVDVHDKRINNHSERLDKLEQNNAEFRVQIQNLIYRKRLSSSLVFLYYRQKY